MPEGTSGSKSNDAEATLRKGSHPKAEAVRHAKPEDGAAVKAAKKQNTSDGGSDLTVIPNKGPLAPPPSGCK